VKTYNDPQGRFTLLYQEFTKGFQENPLEIFSFQESETYKHLTAENKKAEYLEVRYHLKNYLAKIFNKTPQQISFKIIGEGKPVIDISGSKLDFSISHSWGHFIVGISETYDIGTDLEKIRDQKKAVQIAERMFSPEEANFIALESDAKIQAQNFTKIWSSKEALVKAAAGGVFKHVHDVKIDTKNWRIEKLPNEFGVLQNWTLEFLEIIPEFVCAVALRERK
jgi:4'-phosphopantetheinyl transferase